MKKGYDCWKAGKKEVGGEGGERRRGRGERKIVSSTKAEEGSRYGVRSKGRRVKINIKEGSRKKME